MYTSAYMLPSAGRLESQYGIEGMKVIFSREDEGQVLLYSDLSDKLADELDSPVAE